jgi:hypothetical protein
MKHLALQRRIAFAVLALGITACGGDLTLPGPGLALEVVQGNGQRGTVGEELPSVVVVQVTSDEGAPLPDQRIVFSSDDPADAFEPDTAFTDAAGKAFTRWVLGTEPGTYSGEARLLAAGDSTVTAAILQASAVAGDPDTLRAGGPTTQAANRGQPLDEPLRVAVVDRFGNPVAGADVVWAVTEGDGTLGDEHTLTGEDGTSAVTWTVGSRLGVQKAEARVAGAASGSPLTFTAVVFF